MPLSNRPIQGVGLGLRNCHYRTIISERPVVPWFEILIDNYMVDGGLVLDHLEKICECYPVVFHSVGLSIGSTDPLNFDYLKRLKQLVHVFEPAWVSDHLSWVSLGNNYLHDLLPLPFNQETITHLVTRIHQVQDYLQKPLLFENVSSYFSYQATTLSEWEFLNEVATQSGCKLLLDLNNIYVNSVNHHFDPHLYLRKILGKHVQQFHLAGYTEQEHHLLDSHGENIHEPVWQLYQQALNFFGDIPTAIEWDNQIPDWEILIGEKNKADLIRQYS